MKKFLFAITIILFLSGCNYNTSRGNVIFGGGRITLKEEVSLNGEGYQIIQVDSVEYLTRYQGGIIKLEK
jgi:hypothetical protein